MKHDDQEDLELNALAQRLGQGGAADRLDPARTAQAVLARLREQPAARRVPRFIRPMFWLQIAAMIAVVLGSSLIVKLVRSPAPSAAATALAEPGLNDLSAGELRDMLRAVDDSTLSASASVDTTVGLEDLSTPELKRLLQSLEG
ncbi:MAG TPA: hypothetical protein VLV45_09080 [Gemmatimonadales bacterium]|nr:hypothetical protein [Gemmatimonadales bacterium]